MASVHSYSRALVTGGGGFIGSHIVDALLAQGVTVLAADDFSTGNRDNLRQAQKSGTKFRLEEVDICSEKFRAAVVAFKPEVIFHLAAQMNVRKSVAEPLFDADKNVLGTISMLEAARESGARRIIFASTGGAIYGEQETFPATEEHRIEPECPYGVSKRCGELYMEYYSRAHKLEIIALRFGNVYGPRQNPKGEAGVVAIFINNLLSGKPLRVNGDGKQTRDFVFVDDVVRANILASDWTKASRFQVFNIGWGIEKSVVDIVDGLRKVWDAEKRPTVFASEFGPALPGEQRRSVIDSRRYQSTTGWKPEVGLDEGLRLTFESFRAAAA